MKRFISDIKKHKNYIKYAISAQLKSEVKGSYLGYLWWLLEPVAFMFIYIFIAEVVFKAREPYFPIFVFAGYTIFSFFSKNIIKSVKLVASNKNIVTKVYIPKFILVIINMGVNFMKMSVSFALILILFIVYWVPVTYYILYIIPAILLLLIVTFGFSCLLMHCGVFVTDLAKLVEIGMRLVFYASGVFFLITTRVPDPWGEILLKVNPIALIINSFRNALLYGIGPELLAMGIWYVVGLAVSWLSVWLIYRNENTYVKVMN